MKVSDLLFEGKSMPCIVVDVQPEYSGIYDGDENPVFEEIIQFVNNQTGPVLMFVNAEEHGLTGDSINGIKKYWEDSGFSSNNWNRVQIKDKGYGYFRSWMDLNVPNNIIIKLIRYMYQSKVTDSRELFGGDDSDNYEIEFRKFIGPDFENWMLSDGITINWTSVAQLKKFNGAYIMGGGRNECMREVEILMNAFNIKYKRIDSLVYG